MTTNWEDKTWQEDFLNMKSHRTSDVKILIEGPRGVIEAWRLGVLHQEYKQLKRNIYS